MHDTLKQLDFITNKVNDIINIKQLKTNPKIIAVTKTFSMDKITPLLQSGHIHYGENKLQETEDKWSGVRDKYKNCRLHMIGKLQSNKAKKAVELFDYIHSLDSEKLASKLFHYQKELNKKVNLFIQVNLANEIQKSGIPLSELNQFYNYCTKELSLNIIGLMCLPPFDSDSEEYFKILEKSAKNLNLADLSMGMSSDYEKALLCGSTFLRLGTLLLGKRKVI